MGIRKDRSRGGCELILAGLFQALVHEAIRPGFGGYCARRFVGNYARLSLDRELGDACVTALKAAYTVRPSRGFEVIVALLLSGEVLRRLYDAGSDSVCFACHLYVVCPR